MSLSRRTKARINAKANEKWRLVLFAIFITGIFSVGSYQVLKDLMEMASSNDITANAVSYVVASFAALIFAILFVFMRDELRWKFYGALETGIGMGVAAFFVQPDHDPAARMVIFLSGVVISVEGLSRLRCAFEKGSRRE